MIHKSLLKAGSLLILFSSLAFSQKNVYSNQECLDCHGKPEISQITIHGDTRSLYVDPEKWSQDIHSQSQMACVDCHPQANPFIHFREGFIKADCTSCHPEEQEEYLKNIHYNFSPVTIGKELPQCYHCHTRHQVLRHDNPLSSIHEENIGNTCGECHSEVMVKGILEGASLGKISGHRKGDIAEKFDMSICINCHYEDAAHGAKRVYKDYCPRCHDVRSTAVFPLGPTHLNSTKWRSINFINFSLVLLFFVGLCAYSGYLSRQKIKKRIKHISDKIKLKDEIQQEKKETGLDENKNGETQKKQ